MPVNGYHEIDYFIYLYEIYFKFVVSIGLCVVLLSMEVTPKIL
jgi:hypothetical protein